MMFHPEIFHVPVKLRLELMSSVGANGFYAKRELLYEIVYRLNGVYLVLLGVNL